MRKIYLKLAVSLISILAAITMVVGATYAWLNLSSSPAVNGINVGIAGGNTILLAPDLTETVVQDGETVTVHYPGAFGNRLNLNTYKSYEYLKKLSPLSPVSTADGLHWILPAYDEETGSILDINEFTVDAALNKANAGEGQQGAYAYVDFWIVSPGSEYDIRVAMDEKSGEGSFLVELPKVVELEDGSYDLEESEGSIAAMARVGFLVNSDTGTSAAMAAYTASEEYDERFKSLLGQYTEKGEVAAATGNVYNFTVYEPNGNLHPMDNTGDYIQTKPLAYNAVTDEIKETDSLEQLMVQKSGRFRMKKEELWLEKILQAAVIGKDFANAEEAQTHFYGNYLEGQIGAYIEAGNFFANTTELQAAAAANGGRLSEEKMKTSMTYAGAAEDVVIATLERNKPQRIRMFIWLEGQDADCMNMSSVEASNFTLGIELSGETK